MEEVARTSVLRLFKCFMTSIAQTLIAFDATWFKIRMSVAIFCSTWCCFILRSLLLHKIVKLLVVEFFLGDGKHVRTLIGCCNENVCWESFEVTHWSLGFGNDQSWHSNLCMDWHQWFVWPCKLKLGEEKSKHAGLAQQNGFGPAFVKFAEPGKRHNKA